MNREEDGIQIAIADYLRAMNIPFQHSPNEAKRDPKTGARLKRMGMSAGFPDIEIPVPRHGKHGLYIELKTKKGRLSDAQREWLELLTANGYEAQMARGLDEAIEIIRDYFAK